MDVDAVTRRAPSPLDSVIGIYDSAGNLLVVNDDDGSTTDSFLAFMAPRRTTTMSSCTATRHSQRKLIFPSVDVPKSLPTLREPITTDPLNNPERSQLVVNNLTGTITDLKSI